MLANVRLLKKKKCFKVSNVWPVSLPYICSKFMEHVVSQLMKQFDGHSPT